MKTLLSTSVLERFLRYVTYDTQSDPDSTTVPSTAKQLVLLDLLVGELKALGLTDAKRDEHGIVTATLPANTKKKNVKVIGLLAHVDTSPELSGADVKPIVHKGYAGGDENVNPGKLCRNTLHHRHCRGHLRHLRPWHEHERLVGSGLHPDLLLG